MSNVSLHSLLSRRFEAGAVAVEIRGALAQHEGLESVAETTRVVIIVEEEGGGAARPARFSLRKLMERCRDKDFQNR